MFTGIIQGVGWVDKLMANGYNMQLCINNGSLDSEDIMLGDSLCVNGVCLTVTGRTEKHITADVSKETQSLTTLANLTEGIPVNLEKALLPSTRIGGHFVSGHVDSVGTVLMVESVCNSIRYRIELPSCFRKYIAKKGSITLDGVSLTINTVIQEKNKVFFDVNIIPFTLENTTLNLWKKGSNINVEIDIIARYVETLMLENKDCLAE